MAYNAKLTNRFNSAIISPMLKIRLQRVARKKVPIFRVVLTDSKNSTKSGRFKEVLGIYNLVTDEKRVNADRVKYWISQGAQPSGTIHNFLVSERIISGKKINVLPKRTPIMKDEPEAPAEVSKAETPVEKKEEAAPEPAETPTA